MGRLPAAAEGGRQRGHSRPPALRRRRLQGAGLRGAQRRRPGPVRPRPGGEQALRPVPGRARQGGRIPRPVPPQPDPPLPGDGRDRVGEPYALGPAHQRPRLAPVRLPRPAPGQRLLRGRPGGPARARPRRGAARLPPALPPGIVHAPGRRRRVLPRGGPGRGAPLRGAGRPGSVGGGLRERLPGPRPGPRRRRAEGRHRRQPAGGPQGGPHLPLPPALRALRRGPGAAAGQRLPLRRLRPAQAGARRRRPQDGGERHFLGGGLQLLRPPPQSLPHHRPGRPVHRPAPLQRRASSPGRPRRCWRRSASPTPRWLP